MRPWKRQRVHPCQRPVAPLTSRVYLLGYPVQRMVIERPGQSQWFAGFYGYRPRLPLDRRWRRHAQCDDGFRQRCGELNGWPRDQQSLTDGDQVGVREIVGGRDRFHRGAVARRQLAQRITWPNGVSCSRNGVRRRQDKWR